jgi:hypothetical protein
MYAVAGFLRISDAIRTPACGFLGGIATLKDAAEWSDRDLLSLPHIGRAYVASLRALMAR